MQKLLMNAQSISQTPPPLNNIQIESLPTKQQGFQQQQQEQNFSPSKQKNKIPGQQLTLDNFYKIPQAKPILSKNFIDYSKPKVLIKQIILHKEPDQLIAYKITNLLNDASNQAYLSEKNIKKNQTNLRINNANSKDSSSLNKNQSQSEPNMTQAYIYNSQKVSLSLIQTNNQLNDNSLPTVTLWQKYFIKTGFQCLYIKYFRQNLMQQLFSPAISSNGKNQLSQNEKKQQKKRIKLQMMKFCRNNENLFNTYFIDLDFITEAGSTLLRNLLDCKLDTVMEKWNLKQKERIKQEDQDEDNKLQSQSPKLRNSKQKQNIFNSASNLETNVNANIVFDSRFECGNLFAVFRKISEKKTQKASEVRKFDLILQNDINTKGYTNWFYFSVKSKFKGPIKFNIVNMQKNSSLFTTGMKVICFSYQKFKKENIEWHRDGYAYSYKRNQISKGIEDGSNITRYNTLSFCIDQKYDDDIIYIAANIPYSYSRLIKFLDSVEKVSKLNSNIYFKRQNSTYTISSNISPILTLTWKRDKKNSKDSSSRLGFQNQDKQQDYKKKIIGIIARQHPCETVSSFVMEGFINSLVYLSGQHSVQLLKKYIFKIIPMVNVDGVIYGNSRCDIAGSDVNRRWNKNPNKFLYPVVNSTKKLFQQLVSEGYQIDYFIDLHGHSKKQGTFIYSCKIADQIQTRLFSWLMSKIINKFMFDNCTFGLSNLKKETARGSMCNNVNNRRSLTVETSFYGYKKLGLLNNANANTSLMKHFQIRDFHQIGQSLLIAIYADQGRDPKLYNWTNLKNQIKSYLENKQYEQRRENEQDQKQSGSDSDPSNDQMTLEEKTSSFLPPTIATKIGLVEIKVVDKGSKKHQKNSNNKLEDGQFNRNDLISGFNQDIDDDYNYSNKLQTFFSKKIQSTTQTKLLSLRQTKSVTKISPFKFSQRSRKSLSTKKIRIAIDIKYLEENKQKMSIPSLLPQIQDKQAGFKGAPSLGSKKKKKDFWSNFNRQYQKIVKQKQEQVQIMQIALGSKAKNNTYRDHNLHNNNNLISNEHNQKIFHSTSRDRMNQKLIEHKGLNRFVKYQGDKFNPQNSDNIVLIGNRRSLREEFKRIG